MKFLILKHITFKTFRYLILRKCRRLLAQATQANNQKLSLASLDPQTVSNKSLQLMTGCTREFFTDFWVSQKQIMVSDFPVPFTVLSISWFLHSLFSLFYPFAKLFYNHYTCLTHIPLQCFHKMHLLTISSILLLKHEITALKAAKLF